MTAPLSTDVDFSIEGTDSSTQTTADGALDPNGDVNTGTLASSSQSESDTITTPSNNGAISQYTVKAGDSLSQIAQSYGVSVNTILWANNITDPSTIKEGTVLVILPVSGIQHTVRSGETISSIAKKFSDGDSQKVAQLAQDITQFNGLSDNSALQAGSTIIIPGGTLPSSEPQSQPQSKSKSSSSKSSSSKSKSSSSKSSASTSSDTSSTSGKINYSDETGNPYIGGSGAAHHGFFTNPLPGALLTQGIHGWNAVDLAIPGRQSGAPILAAADGTVILSRTGGWNGGYGNYVILDNGSGIETLYAHMSQTKADVGETVSAGQVIGYVGMTGDATGPHLHFEVRGAQNPFAYCQEMQVCSPE